MGARCRSTNAGVLNYLALSISYPEVLSELGLRKDV